MEHTVLFVDDEPMVTDALKRALRKEPYRFISASSAEEAFNILANEPVDVVVSDEMMPGMPGSEFLSIVRKRYPDTIRMILTGHASLDAAIRAINEGEVYRFFSKPCNEADLAVTIRQALRQKKLANEAKRLLQVSRYQSSLIEKLEHGRPDLANIDRDTDGAIVIEESPEEIDLDKLIMEINEQANLRRKKDIRL